MATSEHSLRENLNKKRRTHAKTALLEAAQRKQKIDAATSKSKTEINGRGSLDPARFNDWEVKGIASDF